MSPVAPPSGGPAPLDAPSPGALVLAVALLGVAFVPLPTDRAVGSDRALSLGQFLELRAALHVPLPAGMGAALDPLPPIRIGPRGCELLLPHVVERSDYRFDNQAEIGIDGESFATWERGAASGGITIAVLADEVLAPPDSLDAGPRAELQTRLATELLESAPSEVARVSLALGEGASPLLQLARMERWPPGRSPDRIVAVWSLEDDLAETDLVRRVVCHVPPGGDVDALVRALHSADRVERTAAQESWLGEHPEARDAVERFLTTAGVELQRRARLYGARAHIVLVPFSEGTPHATLLARRIVDDLRERGVDITILEGLERLGERGTDAWRRELYSELMHAATK